MITTKARRVLGLIYRRFYRHLSSCKLLSLYVAQVRPILEYGAVVWDPFIKKDRLLLECTQKFALRMCLKDWNLHYSSLLCSSHLPSLADRRKYLKLCILLKFIHQLASSPTSFELRHRDSRLVLPNINLCSHLREQTLTCILFYHPLFICTMIYLLIFCVLFLFLCLNHLCVFICCCFFGVFLWAHFVLAFGYCVSCAVHKLIQIKKNK